VTTEIVGRELDVANGKFLGSCEACLARVGAIDSRYMRTGMKSRLERRKTIVLEHVKKGLIAFFFVHLIRGCERRSKESRHRVPSFLRYPDPGREFWRSCAADLVIVLFDVQSPQIVDLRLG
jgi:hypothetical protein